MVDYPKDWEKRKLGDLTHIQTGSKNNEEKFSRGKYPFYVRSAKVERINTYSYDTEAILVPGEGNIGSIFHYINGKFDVHQRVYAIINFSSQIDAKYIYWFMFRNFGNYALSQTSKATVDSLRLPAFKEFQICFPSLNEQQAIADTLQAFDQHIEKLDQLIHKKKMIRDGALEDLMTGKTRLEGFDEDWEEVGIGEILKIIHGNNQHSVESSTGKYPILGTGGVIGKADHYLCDWECVCIGRKGTIDKPLYVDYPFWSIDTLYYSKPLNGNNAKFQYYLFKTINWQEHTESSGRPSLSKIGIESITVKIPTDIQEQETIADVLTIMDDEIDKLEKEKEKIEQIKAGAMDDLLTGKIRLV